MNRIVHFYYQDTSKSLCTASGEYDYTHFSAHEACIIKTIFADVKQEYPPEYQGVYLAAFSEPIKYKPRHVLFKSVILLLEGSDSPLDHLALARAYEAEGYYYVEQALQHYERFYERAIDAVLPNLPYAYYQRFLYLSTSKLYEKMGDYTSALKYADLMSGHCSPYEPPNWDLPETEHSRQARAYSIVLDQMYNQERRDHLLKKLSTPARPKERKQMGAERRELENAIQAAAEFFVGNFWN